MLTKIYRYIPILFFAAWSCSAFSAGEEDEKNSLSPWDMCETAIEKLEMETTVPSYLLKHLSLAKSGRFDQENLAIKPWPWTVSINEFQLFFDTREKAFHEARMLVQEGWSDLKFGCLQIRVDNLDLVASKLSIMFDPANNIRLGADYLTRLYQNGQNWQTALDIFISKGMSVSLKPNCTIDCFSDGGIGGAEKISQYKVRTIDYNRTAFLNKALKDKKQANRQNLGEENKLRRRKIQLSAWRSNRARPEALAQLLAIRIAENAKREEQKISKLSNKAKKKTFSEKRKKQLSDWRKKIKSQAQKIRLQPY
ncbi:MAG: hypothetical protein CFH06_00852 [Alphaproteobacteria bacterium MarineAlpha3_Bin5]|nr:hypothetical protein [Magnetovibrio sp.]PPR78321.1 MAG: hypothetical protein CFH06_00852 [Alphaproteobacteria bacterium MarineAlpha3_Bin5]|tara:strand:+ start:739 stop:1668 length:930 start_codon:yes stop_codon:yes gene_type:complete